MRWLLALVLLHPAIARADAVREPTPIEDCPAGSVSTSPGMGLFHGSFAYCAAWPCGHGGTCPGDLQCRELMLQIRTRSYSRGGGHGAPPGPAEQVSEVVGPCEDPLPGIEVPTNDREAIFEGPEVAEGCRRVRVCAPPRMGDPMGTTPEAPPPDPEPAPEPPPPPAEEEVPEPPEPTPAPPPEAPPSDSGGCACRASASASPGPAIPALLIAAVCWRRRWGLARSTARQST